MRRMISRLLDRRLHRLNRFDSGFEKIRFTPVFEERQKKYRADRDAIAERFAGTAGILAGIAFTLIVFSIGQRDYANVQLQNSLLFNVTAVFALLVATLLFTLAPASSNRKLFGTVYFSAVAIFSLGVILLFSLIPFLLSSYGAPPRVTERAAILVPLALVISLANLVRAWNDMAVYCLRVNAERAVLRAPLKIYLGLVALYAVVRPEFDPTGLVDWSYLLSLVYIGALVLLCSTLMDRPFAHVIQPYRPALARLTFLVLLTFAYVSTFLIAAFFAAHVRGPA